MRAIAKVKSALKNNAEINTIYRRWRQREFKNKSREDAKKKTKKIEIAKEGKIWDAKIDRIAQQKIIDRLRKIREAEREKERNK